MAAKKTVKVWTKEEVISNLQKSDEWVRRGLVVLYSFQTETEQCYDSTTERNNVGFNMRDAPFLSDLARQVLTGRRLSEKQMAAARRSITKYAGQLMRLANAKAEAAAASA